MKSKTAAIFSVAGLCAGVLLSSPARAATIIQSTGASYVSFEAETPSPIINGTPAIWVVTNDVPASGGQALYIGGTTDNARAPHSFVQYQIRFATPGTYNLYYRWRADAARTVADQFTANSSLIPNTFGAFSTAGAAGAGDFHTGVSNGTQAPANNVYDWTAEADGTTTYTVTAEQVAAGTPLVLSIGTREAGFMVDRWILSTETGLSDATLDAVINSDTSVVNQGATDSFVAFEAEARGTIINGTPAFWRTTNDVPASGGGALYIDGTTDNASAPHSFVQYQVKFSQPGTYNLYYRWKADPARTVADQFTANSTLIPNTFGAFSTAGAAGAADFHTSASNGTQSPANNVYDWSREADGTTTYTVTAEQVAAGVPLVFSVGTREAGFTVDRWVFSPEPALTDAALDALPNSGAAPAGPELVKAVGSGGLNTVRVFLSRPLAPATVAASDFAISGGLTVNSATVDTEDPRQVLLTTSGQTQGTVYTITVNGVSDTSGNAIAANSTVNFSGWKLAEGWATTEIYQNVTGTTVEELKNAPAFIARTPDEVRWVKGFQLNNDPRAPNMGARISAFFTPPTAGSYNFYVNNDNEAELLLSTDQSEAGLQSLNVFPLSPPVFDDAIFVASPDLASGQRYLLEGLLKSDGGDVYLNVAAQPSTSSAPASSLPVLGGNRISTFVNPDLGNVTFTEQPVPVTATAAGRATFAVKVKANEAPVYYQWKVNGVDIPGATLAAYTTPVLSTADSGKNYSVVVSVAGKDTTSGTAALTVNAGEPSNLQPYVGINFVGGGDNLPGILSSVAVAGVVQQENWNNLTGFQFDQAPLRDAAGATTPVTVSAQATEHWYSGTLGSGTANGLMLQGFLSTGAATDPFLITLNGVPAGTYNLIMYSVGFPFQADYQQDVSLTGSGNYPTYFVKAETGLEFNASPNFRRMASTAAANRAVGNYVQFDNVSPAVDGSLVLSTTWVSPNVGNTHQPAVNGIQLIKVGPAVNVRPTLTTSKQGNILTVTWTANAAGFTLETSPTVGAGASWTAVAGTPNPIVDAGSATINLTGSRGFYRLRKP